MRTAGVLSVTIDPAFVDGDGDIDPAEYVSLHLYYTMPLIGKKALGAYVRIPRVGTNVQPASFRVLRPHDARSLFRDTDEWDQFKKTQLGLKNERAAIIVVQTILLEPCTVVGGEIGHGRSYAEDGGLRVFLWDRHPVRGERVFLDTSERECAFSGGVD